MKGVGVERKGEEEKVVRKIAESMRVTVVAGVVT